MSNEDPAETVTKAVKGEDRPMEEKHPTTPFALVFFTYPLILILSIIVIAAVIMIF